MKELHDLIENSCCDHKLCIVCNDDIKELYQKMTGSLNLCNFFSRDGIIRTHGIQTEKNHFQLRSTLIDENKVIRSVEIANLRPIILDYSRCGILEPAFFFVGVDFHTCIASVFDPESLKWKTAYLIQCDDSGFLDMDMVKICFVNDQPMEHGNDPDLGTSNDFKWLKYAQNLARPENRFTDKTIKNRSLRLETETKSGIVTLPVLEPYLEVKWPKELHKPEFNFPHPELEKHSLRMLKMEKECLENKRFGV